VTGRFIGAGDVAHESVDWGELTWIVRPSISGSGSLALVEVTVHAGRGHAFHVHPEQSEVIWVREGRIEQWIGQERRELGPGEAAFVPPGTVHASFALDDAPARFSVVLAPAVGEDGYITLDVSDSEPWASLRSRP
jgi:quercetin dioxygenase-like cupin family protein